MESDVYFAKRRCDRIAMQSLQTKVHAKDAGLMAGGYAIVLKELGIFPDSTEAEKELVDAAVKVAMLYEERARELLLNDVLDKVVTLWGDELPELEYAMRTNRRHFVDAIRVQLMRVIECIKIDGGDYEA